MKKINNILLCLIPIADLFSAFSLFSIGSFSFTLSFFLMTLFIVSSFITFIFDNSPFNKNCVFFACCWLFLLLFAFIANKSSTLSSLFLYFFYIVLLFCVFNTTLKKPSKKFIKAYTFFLFFFNFLGILQFVSQFSGLGYFSLTISNHMTSGYNTTNLVSIGNSNYYRAHSIYLEPSTLSQYSVISIVLAYLMLKKARKGKKAFLFFQILIGALACLLSFSGTGLILLFFSLVFLLFQCKKFKAKPFISTLIFVVLGISMIGIFINSNISAAFTNRIFEFKTVGSSSYLRFIYPYEILSKVFSSHFWGYGPGSDGYVIQFFNPGLSYLGYANSLVTEFSSSWAKIGSELGIFAILLLISFCFNIYRKSKNVISKFFVFVFILSLFLGGGILGTYMISFLILSYYCNRLNFDPNQYIIISKKYALLKI